MHSKKTIFFILNLVFAMYLAGQSQEMSRYTYFIHKTNEKISIDGSLDEPVWQTTGKISNFTQHYPADTIPAEVQTEVMITYDEKSLYFGVICHGGKDSAIVQTLKRDDLQRFFNSDGFSIAIDPLNKDKNGYYFALNTKGVQVDGTVSQYGNQPVIDTYWDNHWFSEVKPSSDGYVYEIAIPFSAIKYNHNKTWGINFTRNDMKRGFYYVWTQFPRNFDGNDLTFNGSLKFVDSIPESKFDRFEFFPSISGKFIKDFENNAKPEYKPLGGIDSKIALKSDLNLNLSVYPDFSMVDVDQQYIDFYRYEYKVAEQRLFFLENNDLFSNFGSEDNFLTPGYSYKIKPFYTRRIGINNWEYFQIYYGARLSGNINDNLRVGMMNVQTSDFKEVPEQNFSVGSFQQRLGSNSTLKGIAVNRQNIHDNQDSISRYNRNAGLEYEYVSSDSKWTLFTKYHRSFNTESSSNAGYFGAGMMYNTQKFRMQNFAHHVGTNFIADAGYIPRLYQKDDSRDTTIRQGYTQLMNNMVLEFAQIPGLSFNGMYSNLEFYFNPDKRLDEIQQEIGYYLEFTSRSSIYAGFKYNYLDLTFPFDVLKNDHNLPAKKYHYYSFLTGGSTDPRKPFSFGFDADYGTFYNGKKLFSSLRAEYHAQPWGLLMLAYNYCQLRFPVEYGNADYHLITGKSEIGFSKKVFWTTLLQYNTQEGNVNFNTLLKWRYKPLCDFSFVVKDDMETGSFGQKKLQVIFRLNYWFKV